MSRKVLDENRIRDKALGLINKYANDYGVKEFMILGRKYKNRYYLELYTVHRNAYFAPDRMYFDRLMVAKRASLEELNESIGELKVFFSTSNIDYIIRKITSDNIDEIKHLTSELKIGEYYDSARDG